MEEIDPHIKPASDWVKRVIVIGTVALIALYLLTGCGKILTPMPDNQVAPFIFWEKNSYEMDNYIYRHCSVYG